MQIGQIAGKISVGAAAIALASLAAAYEPDTHFQVTYIECRAVGFTAEEALTVAAADQGMDDSPGTVANGGSLGAIPNVPEESLWHALDKSGKMGASGIFARKQLLFKAAKNAPGQPLYLLGVFFHYQQDTWAHRHHYNSLAHSPDAYTTYNTPLGHAPAGHQPDRPPFDPGAATMCMEEGVGFAQKYLTDVLHRTPSAFLSGYTPMGPAAIDKKWHSNSTYFHQAAPEPNAPLARQFMVELIRAQISAYKSSPDLLYTLHRTADEAKLTATASKMQKVCDDFKDRIGVAITIPTTAEKEQKGFMKVTTAQLLKDGMPSD